MLTSPLNKTEIGLLVQSITKAVVTSLATPIPSAIPVPVKAPGKRKVSAEHVARINRERDRYFKKMGYGKYRKTAKKAKAKPIATKKEVRKAAKAIRESVKIAAAKLRLEKGRDAYFKRKGYGKYAKTKRQAA